MPNLGTFVGLGLGMIMLGATVWADGSGAEYFSTVIVLCAVNIGAVIAHDKLISKEAELVWLHWWKNSPYAVFGVLFAIAAFFYLNMPVYVHDRMWNNPVLIFSAWLVIAPPVMAIFSLLADRGFKMYDEKAQKIASEWQASRGVDAPAWVPPTIQTTEEGNSFDPKRFS